MPSQVLLAGLGGPELALMAAIALVLVGVSRLAGFQRAGALAVSRNRADAASSRAYLDRLVGTAGGPAAADRLRLSREARR
jgi:Sec-independent protein translocase protein TatA